MRVAVIDVGSNTARLLVAARSGSAVRPIHEERALLALGDEIERFGHLGELKIAETAERCRRYAETARGLGASTLDVIVTAPGRQSANAAELLGALRRAVGASPRVLSPDEEGRLAYAGAVGQARGLPDRVAVCDVGGGSTELVVGTRGGIEFCRSIEVGSLRLSRRILDDDPPGKKAVAAARAEIEARFEDLAAPAAEAALATGGSARSLRRLIGTRTLAEDELAAAAKLVTRRTAAQISRETGLDPVRARTLLAGTLILAAAQRRLGLPLQIARGGIREGAAAALLAQRAAA
jgi:exopolyphosphatase/guanosine-5'-triphosphate,3'-diphosphate pyrophosphatase